MHSIENMLSAYSSLPEAGAGALDPDMEQRLQALLADGVLPLLLRCLKAWMAGAHPLQKNKFSRWSGCARSAALPATMTPPCCAGCARCCRAAWSGVAGWCALPPMRSPGCSGCILQQGLWPGLHPAPGGTQQEVRAARIDRDSRRKGQRGLSL